RGSAGRAIRLGAAVGRSYNSDRLLVQARHLPAISFSARLPAGTIGHFRIPARKAHTMSRSDADRNLLFGVLALQADLLDTARFAEACSARAARKETSLADLLVERGWLTIEDKNHVEYLLERKLRKYGGDAQASLAAVAGTEVRRVLATVDDDDAVARSL